MKPLEVKPGSKEPGTRFVGRDLKWLYALAVFSVLSCILIALSVIFLILSGHINF